MSSLRLAAAAFAPCHAVLFRIVPYCGGACAPVARDIQVASAVQFTGLRESALAHAGFLRPVDVAYGRCAIGDALHCLHFAAPEPLALMPAPVRHMGAARPYRTRRRIWRACGMYRVVQVFLLQSFMTVCLDKADCARHGAGTRTANIGFRPQLVKPQAHKAFTSKFSA